MNPPVSAKRIAIITASIAGIFVAITLVGPVARFWHRITEPVLMLPEIHGFATLHGKPLAGLEVRRAITRGSKFPDCKRLPVVGISDASGAFHVHALYRPRLLMNLKGETSATCYMYGEAVITALLGFLQYNQFSSIEVRCKLPRLHSAHREDSPCYFVDANYSLQPTVNPLRGLPAAELRR